MRWVRARRRAVSAIFVIGTIAVVPLSERGTRAGNTPSVQAQGLNKPGVEFPRSESGTGTAGAGGRAESDQASLGSKVGAFGNGRLRASPTDQQPDQRGGDARQLDP